MLRRPKRTMDPPGRGCRWRALWDHVVHVSDLISIHETFLPKAEDYVVAPRYAKRTSSQRRGRRRWRAAALGAGSSRTVCYYCRWTRALLLRHLGGRLL